MSDQIIINVTDQIPPANQATIDLDGLKGNTYSKTQIDEKLKNPEVEKVRMEAKALDATPIPGSLEYDGSDLYFVTGTGVRKKVTLE